MAEICGWIQDTLKIAKISSAEIYHTTMSQKLQITWNRNKIISLFVEEVFVWSLKALKFLLKKCWHHHFWNLCSFDVKISNFKTRITRMADEDARHFSLMENVMPIISTKTLHFGKFILKHITKLEEIVVLLKNGWRWSKMSKFGQNQWEISISSSRCQRKFKTHRGILQHMQFCKEDHALIKERELER